MPIPDEQLETWSHQGAITNSARTYDAIKGALEDHLRIDPAKYEVYLQGSYRNSTNVRGDSDVDVVVQYLDTWYSDRTRLTPPEETAYKGTYGPATYHWPQFRGDVLDALRHAFGADISPGKNSLKLRARPGTLAADIVPAVTYKRFFKFRSRDDQRFAPGITFFTQPTNDQVNNYPKVHYDNGVAKNALAPAYKSTVRMFKNARNCLIDRGEIAADQAPSYFLECLVYNIPNDRFTGNRSLDYFKVLEHLVDNPPDQFVCQNENVYLFGSTPQQWSIDKARLLVSKFITLARDW